MKEGGQAFPIPGSSDYDRVLGLTARDYFAAKALNGLLAAEASAEGGGAFNVRGMDGGITFTSDPKNFAAAAYLLADAMIRARGDE